MADPFSHDPSLGVVCQEGKVVPPKSGRFAISEAGIGYFGPTLEMGRLRLLANKGCSANCIILILKVIGQYNVDSMRKGQLGCLES